MSDSDDVVFVEESPSTLSNAAKITPSRDRPNARTRSWLSAASPQSQNASSVLLTNWIAGARREAASTQRLDALRKAAGVMRSPPKRPKIERKSGDAAVDTITLDDQEEVAVVEEKVNEIEQEGKESMNVTGSVVAAVTTAFTPRSPLRSIRVSPANSQASQGSKVGSASSVCDDETQENDGDLAASQERQERRTAALRDCLRVDDAGPSLRDGDVIRNRADRAAMHGQDCPCCSEYYDHLGMDEEERRKRIDQVSRHRYVARPMPKTPPHYWDMDFPTEAEQEARGMLTRRVEEKVEHSGEEIKDQPDEKEEIIDQPEEIIV